jgi:hypothetical protein
VCRASSRVQVCASSQAVPAARRHRVRARAAPGGHVAAAGAGCSRCVGRGHRYCRVPRGGWGVVRAGGRARRGEVPQGGLGRPGPRGEGLWERLDATRSPTASHHDVTERIQLLPPAPPSRPSRPGPRSRAGGGRQHGAVAGARAAARGPQPAVGAHHGSAGEGLRAGAGAAASQRQLCSTPRAPAA